MTVHTTALVMLHGLGSSPQRLGEVMRWLDFPDEMSLELVLPCAPTLPVTINAGAEMPAWYDILSLQAGGAQDAAGIQRASHQLGAVIDGLCARGIPHRHIVIGGFSQGGAVALYYANRSQLPLAGVLALSTYVPLMDELPQAVTPAGRATPIFMSHGIYDKVIPLDYAQASRRALEQAGCQLEWKDYPLEHNLDAQVLTDVKHWLVQRLTE